MTYKLTFDFIRQLVKSTKGNVPTWAIQLIAMQLGLEPNKVVAFVNRLVGLSDQVLDTIETVINFEWQFGADGPDRLTDGGGCDCPDCGELQGHEDVVYALKAENKKPLPAITVESIAA